MMAKIGLTGGFKPLPEGTYILKVESVEYKETFGKLRIKFVTKDGRYHTEQFSLLDSKGKPNDGAYNAFSYLAKTLLDDFDRDEIDDQELVGHYIKCSIEHNVVEGSDGRVRTFAHLGNDKEVAHGFDDETAAEETDNGVAEPAGGDIDLDALLGLKA
jgi:hypothetical protein